MKAIADVEALIPQYKSDTEEKFAQIGGVLLGAHFGQNVIVLQYEPCRWKIPGGFYTPDWLCLMETGMVVFVEVKSSKKQKGYRDARSKLRSVAVLYPFFSWVEVVEEDGWRVEVLP